MKQPALLIDGDLIVYRSCVAVEKDVRWDEDYHILFSSFEDAWTNVELALTKLFERFDTDKHVIALTTGRNFRYDVDPTYKGNRTGQRKPLAFARVREELEARYTVYQHPGIEADDVLGIFATRDPNTIICSADKDMKTVPATVFDGKDVVKISREHADFNFLTQVLTGDTADGYPGCPGIGPKKAEAILLAAVKAAAETHSLTANSCYTNTPSHEGVMDECWRGVVAAYEKAGLTEADALKQARLARILRSSDWDAEKKEPILWTP